MRTSSTSGTTKFTFLMSLRFRAWSAAGVFKKAGGADDGGYAYLAIYELDTEDVGATMKELVDRTGDGTFVMSEAFEQDRAFSGLFEPV